MGERSFEPGCREFVWDLEAGAIASGVPGDTEERYLVGACG